MKDETRRTHKKYWLDSAQHDLESAISIFDSGRYDWCLFVGHLALEKILKAIFVASNNDDMPPKTHNLVRLAELSQIDLNEEQRFLLDTINDFNLQTRYPDYKLAFYKRCTESYATESLGSIKEFFAWFTSLLESRIQ